MNGHPAKSHAAIVRELNRITRAWRREGRRLKAAGFQFIESQSYTRLEAARQALTWAAGGNAMSMSRIVEINWRWQRKSQRAARRRALAGRTETGA